MSRSGYSDDAENLGLYRANVDRAIMGKRGQKLLCDMAAALDAMPVKELAEEVLVQDSEHVCALGAVAVARKLDVSDLDIHDGEAVAKAFRVAPCLAREVAYKNDECAPYRELPDGRYSRVESPAERWARMRAWVAANIRPADTSSPRQGGE